MMIAISGRRLDQSQHRQIQIQLGMVYFATIFSILPLLLEMLGLPNQWVWRTASGIWLLLVPGLNAFGVVRKLGPTGPASRRMPSRVLTVSGVILLSLNLWLATPWPYILQLFLAWNASMLLFLFFISDMLGQADEKSVSQ
jgi:hypothetical protein